MDNWKGLDIAGWEEFEERLQRLNELQANVLLKHGGRSSTMLFRLIKCQSHRCYWICRAMNTSPT